MTIPHTGKKPVSLIKKIPLYRLENNCYLIEITLDSPDEFFNSMDPAPQHMKDLDGEVESYISIGAQDVPLHAPVKIVIYLPQEKIPETDVNIMTACTRNFFSYMHWKEKQDLKKLFRTGRVSLLMGLAILSSAMILSDFLTTTYATSKLAETIAEGLTIMAWVSMWVPIQTLLYEWWPIKHNVRVFDKLKEIDVEIRPWEEAPEETIETAPDAVLEDLIQDDNKLIG